MKTLILLSMLLGLSACASVPSLFGQADVTKRWVIHPDDRAQFEADRRHCQVVVAGSRYGEAMQEKCLQQIGYRLEVVKE